MKKYVFTIWLASIACVCVLKMTERTAAQANKSAAPTAPPVIDKEKIREHVKQLSSDEMEGRGTGQRGGDLAADYIAKQFASYGLKPAGDNGTFFENVPMVGVELCRRQPSSSLSQLANLSKRKILRIL